MVKVQTKLSVTIWKLEVWELSISVNFTELVLFEIKKKFKGVVYKRRISLPLAAAEAYLERGERPFDSQIMREIDYAMRFYGYPAPAALIAYEREAYFVKDLPALRVTFDTNVRYRTTDLSAKLGSHGTPIIPSDCILMEIKTDGAMPCWLATALDRAGIFPSSFSKYGTAYKTLIFPTLNRDCTEKREEY